MFQPERKAFLEGGCALIVGTVSAEGEPCATRGWGLDVLPGPHSRVRLLLDADDARPLANLDPGAAIAITGADVRTLQSMQLKGRSLGVEAATDADPTRAARFVDAFFADIVETDGTPRAVLDRFVPAAFCACVVDVVELFDQTPGPAAGAPVGPGTT